MSNCTQKRFKFIWVQFREIFNFRDTQVKRNGDGTVELHAFAQLPCSFRKTYTLDQMFPDQGAMES